MSVRELQEKLEEARILSVKEPMFLKDRMTLNGLIRDCQRLQLALKDELMGMVEEERKLEKGSIYLSYDKGFNHCRSLWIAAIAKIGEGA
jgi:hypothetical protein